VKDEGLMSKRAALRNILLPVDGSAPSRRGMEEGIRLARQLGATITAVHVITPFEAYAYMKGLQPDATRAGFEKAASRSAARILGKVERACRAARVACRCCTAWDTLAADAIARVARLHRCDLVVMASHGRQGMQRVLMGSVTRAVLARSRIPVVVCP
jgi:nucleotide-binding universal stress UspA family protein